MATWKEQLNKHGAIKPPSIAGLANGKFPDDKLVEIRGGDGKVIGRLIKPAAQAWKAMTKAALADEKHIKLQTSTPTNTYRPFEKQQQIFFSRYKESSSGSTSCNGKRWVKLAGEDTAACPGTSNHGWGLAVDVRMDPGVLSWLEEHAHRFGWEWGVKSEDWHIHYFLGDRLPEGITDDEELTMDVEAKKAFEGTELHLRNIEKVLADLHTAVLDPSAGLQKRLADIEAKLSQ